MDSSFVKEIKLDETKIDKIAAIIEKAYLHCKKPQETQEEIKKILMEAR
jgi:hypothetical protein